MPNLLAAAVIAACAIGEGQPAAQTHVMVITGASGEPQYAQAFDSAGSAIATAARARFGLPDANVIYLGEDPARGGGRARARSTKENVTRELAALAGRAGPNDQVWVVLVGHGSGQGDASRFNLPGPDLTAAEFARLLAPLKGRQVAFVNAASASGDWAKALAGPNRAVVTATKSALERNETRFARHFAAALAAEAGGADVDKDGRVSLLEAYGYARREVARAYEADNRLLTEHAQLDDNGDGVATAEPGAGAGDGALAAAMALGGGTSSADPRVAALVAERRALEGRVAALRQRKDSLDAAAYERQLEALLVELAQKSQQIRAAEGRKP